MTASPEQPILDPTIKAELKRLYPNPKSATSKHNQYRCLQSPNLHKRHCKYSPIPLGRLAYAIHLHLERELMPRRLHVRFANKNPLDCRISNLVMRPPADGHRAATDRVVEDVELRYEALSKGRDPDQYVMKERWRRFGEEGGHDD